MNRIPAMVEDIRSAPSSETLREEQGRDHEDHQTGDHDETDGVDGAHNRSTALTTSPRITKTATVRATKMTSAIPTPRIRGSLATARRAGHMQGNPRFPPFLRVLTGPIRPGLEA
ncbi:hypothetical protein GCM10018952_27100 [Streptosporangium vulgare]